MNKTELKSELSKLVYFPCVIKNVVEESLGVKSYYLKPIDKRNYIDFRMGQHILIKQSIKGISIVRAYTISDKKRGKCYRITVKQNNKITVNDATSLSHYIHDYWKKGDCVEVSYPQGEFCLIPDFRPICFLAAGIGITPVISMSKELIGVARFDWTVFRDFIAGASAVF